MNLWRGTVCTNCEKENECAEEERLFKSGAIAYGCSGCVPKPQTNADRIRQMSDEELADKFIFGAATYSCPPNDAIKESCIEDKDCRQCWLEWLKATVEEGEE